MLRNFGNSIDLIIQKPIRESLHLSAGQTIMLEQVENGLLIKVRARRYTLQELLAQWDLNAPMPKDIAEWQAMPAIGKEAW